MESSLLRWFIPVLVYVTCILAKRRSRLKNIPGPFIASFTNLWRWYHQNYYSFTTILTNLHDKYGDVVRIGPNTVSFSSSDAVSVIYNAHGNFKKADSYQPLRSVANGQIKGSVIDTQDEALVSQIRRAIGGTFAEKNILDYEAEVDETCDQLIQVIPQSQQFDLFAITGRFQADFLSKIAFGEEAQHLQAGADSSYLSFHSRFKHWMQWQAMPYLELLWCKTPYLIPYFKAKTHPPLWARMADLKLQSRLAEPEQRSSGLKKPDLLEKYLRGGERRGDKLPLEAIPRMVSSTISAGFDTTAFTMTTMLYFLCRTPSTMEKLCRELDEAHLTTRPSFHDTQHLKYLGAVMKETMRLYPFLQLLLEREAPSGGATVCGKHLPAGTIVGCHPSISHRDPALYGQDADMFRPERWLTVCPEKLSVMDKASLGFGNGKRICIGRHLAEMEIKKVVPRLLLAFNVEIIDPHYSLTPDDIYTSFPKPFTVRFTPRTG